jgi:hypothetical protein
MFILYTYNTYLHTCTLVYSQDYPARISQQVDKNGYWTKGRGKAILQLLEQVTNKVKPILQK